MFGILRERFHQGYRTASYPDAPRLLVPIDFAACRCSMKLNVPMAVRPALKRARRTRFTAATGS